MAATLGILGMEKYALTRGFTNRGASAYSEPDSRMRTIIVMAGSVLAQTFMDYRQQLLRYLRARGAGDDAEDLLQDLWIKAQSGDGEDVQDPRSYLFRMAHNVMLDRIRAGSRRTNREAIYRVDIRSESGDVSDIPSIDRILIAKQRLQATERVLAALGPKTDYIFRRHRIDEIAQKQIADELGLTLSAVEKQLQKAYRALADSQRALERAEAADERTGGHHDDAR